MLKALLVQTVSLILFTIAAIAILFYKILLSVFFFSIATLSRVAGYILYVLSTINRKNQLLAPHLLELLRIHAELFRVFGNRSIISQTFDELSILIGKTECSNHLVERLRLLLETVDKNKYPLVWAKLQMGLGMALQQNHSGNLALDIEESISVLEMALEVMTRQAMSVEASQAIMNLANAYRNSPLGDPSDNIEQAIALYEKSLQVTTRESIPILWSDSMENLAISYRNRIKGDRASNVDRAINAYEQALTVRTRDAMPEEWVSTMCNLANAYYFRRRGGRNDNLLRAIAICNDVCQAIVHEDDPLTWARVHLTLANAYSDLSDGDKIENIRKAISLYQKSLTVMTYETIPVEWALATTNLANAYLDLKDNSRAANIEKAIFLYQKSLRVRTSDIMPFKWATTMSRIGNAYLNRDDGISEENIAQAESAFNASLSVFDPERTPFKCREVAYSLANLYSDQHRWDEACLTYHKALQSAENLYKGSLLLDSKAEVLKETADLPCRAAYSYARAGHFSDAVEILEHGRARGLSESLNRDASILNKLREHDKHFHLYKQYRSVAGQLSILSNQQRSFTISDYDSFLTIEEIRKAVAIQQRHLEHLAIEIRQISGFEDFLVPLTINNIQKTVELSCPLIYLLSTPVGSLALIVTTRDVKPIWLNSFNEYQLISLLKDRWFSAYKQFQNNPIYRKEWLTTIDDVTRQMWEPMMQPIIQQLKEDNYEQATLIPFGYLGLLPLHAAWTEDSSTNTGRRYALDDVCFTYIPNAFSLKNISLLPKSTQAVSLLAVNNPRPTRASPLLHTEQEVQIALSYFPRNQQLHHEKATHDEVLKALSKHNVLHFSCHGSASLDVPLNSGLLMANDRFLTLKDFFSLQLKDVQLAILSACETSLYGTELPNEVISLPIGLLQAGVAGVVGSLWVVNDLSTTILIARFYYYWQEKKCTPPDALRKAQQWTRDTANVDKITYFQSSMPELSSQLISRTESSQSISTKNMHPSYSDFTSPFYWAAFTYVGR